MTGRKRAPHETVFASGRHLVDRLLCDNRRPVAVHPVAIGVLSLTVGYSKLSDELPTERLYLVTRGVDPQALKEEHERYTQATPTRDRRAQLADLRTALGQLDDVVTVTHGRRRDRVQIRIERRTDQGSDVVPVLSRDIGEQLRRSNAAMLRSGPSRAACQVYMAAVAETLLCGRFESDLNMVTLAGKAGVARADMARHMRTIERSGAWWYQAGVGRRLSHVVFESHAGFDPGQICLDGPGLSDVGDEADEDDDGEANYGNVTLARQPVTMETAASNHGNPVSYLRKMAPQPTETVRSLAPPRGSKTEGQYAPSDLCDDLCHFYTDGECCHEPHSLRQTVGAP